MLARNILLVVVLTTVIAAVLVAQFWDRGHSSTGAKVERLVQTYDNAVYIDKDYQAAKDAATEIVAIAEESGNSNATEVRGLIRLVFLEMELGEAENGWEEKLTRCEELVTEEPTVDRADYLLYAGMVKGRFQKKHEEGVDLIQDALWISNHIKNNRTLALAYAGLSELHTLLGQHNMSAGNAYQAVLIAKHHGQKSIEVKTLRNLVLELLQLGQYSEAGVYGKEILEIVPGAPCGLFTQFVNGESDEFLHFVDQQINHVEKLRDTGKGTNRDFESVAKNLNKLSTACVMQKRYKLGRRYALLAMPYYDLIGDKESYQSCMETLLVTELVLADKFESVEQVEKIEKRFKGKPDQLLMNALSTAYAKVGDRERSQRWREQAVESERQYNTNELGFLRRSSEFFWEAELNSRKQTKISNEIASKSHGQVWLLTTALVMGLTVCGLLGSFYLLLRRERNSLEDIVDFKTKSLSEAMKAASAADSAKSEFLAQINHEIRNPLTSIMGYCDLLSLSKDRSGEFIAGIESSSLHLRDLVDRILEVSKIESNGLELNCVDFLPEPTANDINDIMAEKAAKKDLRFACSFRGDSKCLIFSDETKIRQIALNLVGNAIKFTDLGSVTVVFELNKQDKSLLVVVRDTGRGIAENETRSVFDRFAKASNGVACDGSGLGLFITSRLVNCLGGEITLDSELGVGTEVKVRLPVDFTCNAVVNSRSNDDCKLIATETSIAGHENKVVIVDDQEIIRTSMKLLLNANGMECRTAENLEQTVDLIENWRPDLVLLDLRMPKQSGYEVFDRIRQTVSVDVPIYAMTGDATSRVQEKCLALGFNGFITKPFKIKTIQEILQEEVKAT